MSLHSIRRELLLLALVALAIAGLYCFVGCGVVAGVNEVGRDQKTAAGNIASGNRPTTTQQVQQPIATTQQATATAGDKGTSSATSATAAGGHAAQSGGFNIAWQPVAAAGGTGLATVALWLAWSSRNQKRELQARMESEKLDFESDKVLIQSLTGLAEKAMEKRFP